MYRKASKFLLPATILVTALIGSTAGAATFTVSNLNDSGAGSLRDAIDMANAAPGADKITFNVSGTIVLASTLPTIVDGSEITIDGTGRSITVSGDSNEDGLGDVQVMIVFAHARLNLRRLTIAKGVATSGTGHGGGIENIGTLNVTDSTFSGNVALNGGGIFNAGTLTVSNSTFIDNFAVSEVAGGIENGGTLTVSNSTFSNNSAQFAGGISTSGTLSVADSTFSDNIADDAGGIGNFGILTVSNSTFSNNGAISAAGIYSQGTLTVSNSTFSGNSSEVGGGLFVRGPLNLDNTILANNQGGDCVNDGGTVIPSGVNLVEDGSCDPNAITGDPMLGPLADNGGLTLTHALLAGSPAIDAINDGSCPPPATDQRGVARPQGPNCDIGAYEVEVPVDACTTAEVLDNFNRRDGPLGRHWRGDTAPRFYRIHDDQVDVRLGGPVFWNPDRFDANQAAFVTLSRVDTGRSSQGVLLKVQDGDGPHTGRDDHQGGWDREGGGDSHDGKDHKDDASSRAAIAVFYDGRTQAIQVSTIRHGKHDWQFYGKTKVTFADGDKLGGCALANGDVRVYKNDVLVATVKLDRDDKKFFDDKRGKVGIWSRSAPHAILDDFGGGSVTP